MACLASLPAAPALSLPPLLLTTCVRAHSAQGCTVHVCATSLAPAEAREGATSSANGIAAVSVCLRALLRDSSEGCKRRACAASASSSDSERSSRHEWWEWRSSLETRLSGIITSLDALCSDCLAQGLGAVGAPADEKPLVLVLSAQLHELPWESLPCLAPRGVYRALCAQLALALHAAASRRLRGAKPAAPSSAPQQAVRGRAAPKRAAAAVAADAAAALKLPAVDAGSAVYLLDPAGDLTQTRSQFEGWFAGISGWEGSAGQPAVERDALLRALLLRQLFVYLGHGAGEGLRDGGLGVEIWDDSDRS